MTNLAHLRVMQPAQNVLAFYDGRVPGHRFAEGPNWVDDGALSLGIASYVIHDGAEALIYDTHVSVDHAAFIRRTLEGMGITRFTVVLSHWHLDHIAGTAAFAGSQVIANRRTAAHMKAHQAAIEAGTHHGAPPIAPLIRPTHTFDGHAHIHIGGLHIDLLTANIHSDDATVVWMGHPRLLLAGDTMEDCVTYVVEPDGFAAHLADLERLAGLGPARILPNHGAPEVIAAGGYGPALNQATQDYIRFLQRVPTGHGLRNLPLREVIAEPLAEGTLVWWPDYEDVHRQNLARVAGE
jgi:cyclase